MLLHRPMMSADGHLQSAKVSTGSAMLNWQGYLPGQKFWSRVLLSNAVFLGVRVKEIIFDQTGVLCLAQACSAWKCS